MSRISSGVCIDIKNEKSTKNVFISSFLKQNIKAPLILDVWRIGERLEGICRNNFPHLESIE